MSEILEKDFFKEAEKIVVNKNNDTNGIHSQSTTNFTGIYEKENKIAAWPKWIFLLSVIGVIIAGIYSFNLINKNINISREGENKKVVSYFEGKKLNNQKLQEIITSTPVNWSQETVKNSTFPNLSIKIPEGWKAENFEGAGNGGYYQGTSPRIFATSLNDGKNAIAFSIRDNIGLDSKQVRIFDKKDVVKVGDFYRINDIKENMSFYVEKNRVYTEGDEFKKLLNCEDKTLSYPSDFCTNSEKNKDKTIVVGDLIGGIIRGGNVEKLLPTCQKNATTAKCSEDLPIFIISTSQDNTIPDEIVKKAIL